MNFFSLNRNMQKWSSCYRPTVLFPKEYGLTALIKLAKGKKAV